MQPIFILHPYAKLKPYKVTLIEVFILSLKTFFALYSEVTDKIFKQLKYGSLRGKMQLCVDKFMKLITVSH